VKGVFNLDNHPENLLVWMTSCVSGSRARVLIRLRAFLLRERIKRSLIVEPQSISIFKPIKLKLLKNLTRFTWFQPHQTIDSLWLVPCKRQLQKKESYKTNSTILRPFISTHSNAEFKGKICKRMSAPELCNCVKDKATYQSQG
jgi:hypothetical protein